MHSTFAFSESIDAAGAYANLAAVVDQTAHTEGDKFYVPANFDHMIGAQANVGATTPLGAKLESPSIIEFNPYHITPVNAALYPVGEDTTVMFPERPVKLDVEEGLQAFINANPAAAEQVSVIVHMAPGAIQPVSGNIRTIRASVTVAITAGTWAHSTLVLIDDLRVGNYDCVGAKIIASTAVAARFVPRGSNERPGFPNSAVSTPDHAAYFRNGRLGKWFSFHSNTLPGVEIIGSAAVGSATYQILLDLIQR